MKRSAKALSAYVGSVRLYQEDIVALIELMQPITKSIKIEIGGYEFESVDELIQNGPNKATTFDITSGIPYFHVGRGAMTGIHVFSGVDDTQSSGLFFQVRHLLQKCRRRPHFIYNGKYLFAFWICTMILNAAIFAAGLSEKYRSSIANQAELALWGILALWGLFYFIGTTRFACTLHPKTRRQDDSFWQRYHGQIVSACFGAIVTGFFWILSLLVQSRH